MTIKKTICLVGTAIVLIAIGGLFGCSKKEVASKRGVRAETPPTREVEAKKEVAGSKSQKEYFKEAEKAFKRAKEAPASDFVYGLADAGDGVIIKDYKIGNPPEDPLELLMYLNRDSEIEDSVEPVEIVIPSEIEGLPVVELGDRVFSNSPVKTVVIPESVKRFGAGLFREARHLQYVKLPTTITSLLGQFFNSCDSLEYFIIPDHITHIGSSAFSSSGLRSIEIPDTVTSFENWDSLFAHCENLEYVKLPNAIKTLCYTFRGCTALKQVILPESLETLENDVFVGCRSLEQIDLPNTLTFIEPETFSGSGLRSISIPESVTNFQDLTLAGQLEAITLPDNVTHINNKLLGRNKNLKRINLPASLQSIENGAFYELSSLEELIIPETLTAIEWGEENDAFYGTALPLATQAKLKQLGYPGKFN